MRRKILVGLVSIVLIASLIACASFTSTSYKSLFIAGTSYDTAMKSIASLQAQGKITEEQRLEINKYANIFYVSYQVACDALIFYEKTKTQSAKDRVISAIATAILKWAELASYVNRIVPGTLPDKLEVK